MREAHTSELLRRYFAGATESTFQVSLGVADPPLIDYLVDLLVRFVQAESIYRLRNSEGRRIDQVVDMIAEGDSRLGDAQRAAYRHVGDFTLFWSGVYPEALPRLQSRDAKDALIDYRQQGKRSYYLASTIPGEDECENHVLSRLSKEFDLCAYGLNEVRREWGRQQGEGGQGLMFG